MPAQTELVVIDDPDGAASALETFRPRGDRMHLICRWRGELASAFIGRLARYLQRSTGGRDVVALTLVLGADATMRRLVPEVGRALAAALAPTASLTLVGAGASQHDVVTWFEMLRELIAPSVSLDAWFSPL